MQSYYAADKNAQEIKDSETAVHKVATQNPTRRLIPCGLSNHKPDKCRFKEFTCHNCG